MDLDAIGILSHELRTPLTSVHGYALLLQQELDGSLTVPQRERLNTIVKNSSLMLDLINDLLLFARVQSGQQPVSAVPVMLDEVLQAAYEVVEHRLLEKNLDFDIRLADDAPAVPGNFELLRQVFVNLLSNAVKFTDSGTITVTISVADEVAVIEVADTGIGIDTAQLPYIFDEFRQAHSGIRRLYGGTGLGLHICQTLVRFHGGEIHADSRPGAGSVFTVRLPVDTKLGRRGEKADPLVGTQVASYELRQKIGEGGASRVYRASRDGHADVAIKIMPLSSMSSDQAVRQRGEREVAVMSALSHAHIVKLLGVGTEESFDYIIMELAPGQTLRQLLQQQRRLGLERFMQIFMPLVEAVWFAHQHNVVHRDLKPENVMVADSAVKLMDFGMAHPDVMAALATSGVVVGTPAYLAPEQFEGGEVGPWCDQYALGVMAFEMLMGELPFKGPSLVRYMVQHSCQVPPPLCRPELPSHLGATIERMLAKNPADRFATLGEVLATSR